MSKLTNLLQKSSYSSIFVTDNLSSSLLSSSSFTITPMKLFLLGLNIAFQ